MMSMTRSSEPPLKDVVARIVALNEALARFWSRSHGWAPTKAATILSNARLDRLVELSRLLRRLVRKPGADQHEGTLILGWATLGALVEGSLKLLLSVFAEDYFGDAQAPTTRSGQSMSPDGLMLEPLRRFVVTKQLLPEWHSWIAHVQTRRNAIHAFKHREIGTLAEFRADVRRYLHFLRALDSHLPYPDDSYRV